MSWWGKVIGGSLGFMLGGPLGALMGVSLGHSMDTGFSRQSGVRYLPGDQERTQAAFFAATFSVMGYVAKADGKVSHQEISLAEMVMNEMRLDDLQRKAARDLFNQGKQADFDIGPILDQFRIECHRRVTLMRVFLEIQVQAAFADGRLDTKENTMLKDIALRLGFRATDLDRIIDMIRGSHTGRGTPGHQATAESDPYDVLGVTPDTPLAEVRKAYRRLLSQHHPDKLVSKGLPDEMIKLANQKTHQIRMAWQDIQGRHQAG